MDKFTNKLDDLSALLTWMLDWATPQRRLPVIATGIGSTWENEPAPYLEVVFQTEGHYDHVQCGPENFSIEKHCLCVTNVHFGNIARRRPKTRGICFFLDISDRREFDFLTQAPLFLTTPVQRPRRMTNAFKKLIVRGRPSGIVSPQYPPSQEFIDTYRTRPTSPFHLALIKSSVLEILAYGLEDALLNKEEGHRAYPESVLTALDFIDSHLTSPDLDLNTIARSAHLSPNHLGRLFKQYLGDSPMQYLKQVRVQHSCTLLRDTALQIGEIAEEAGFEDAYYFSRVFRSVTGKSPRQYRKDLMKEQESESPQTESNDE